MAVSATFAALFGSDHAFAKGSAGGVQVKGVSAGSAKIQQKNGDTIVTASSKNTVIDYSSFNLTAKESAHFNLPSSNARLLNRIDSPDPSHIDGHVLSNGVIYFVNPAGVVFGPTAVIDVAGLFAAAAHISNGDFLAGVNHFTNAQGSVINQGTLKGDVVTLIGRQAQNSGVILGAQNVTIVSGSDVLVGERFGNLYVKLDAAPTTPTAAAPILSMGSGDLMSMAIVNSGLIQSPDVRLQAGAKGGGGSVALSGHVDASSKSGTGGTVTVTGDNVALTGATIDASGKTGGGTILVGGDAHGTGALQNANSVTVDVASLLRADATGTVGGGGKVVVWSDVTTGFHGGVTARGGSVSGDGGSVETSGGTIDTSGAVVDPHATNGRAGVWLLDPDADLLVTDVTSFVTTLLTGSDVSILTPAGSDATIRVQAPIDLVVPLAKTPTLTITAGGGVSVEAPITAELLGGPLAVKLTAAGDVAVKAAITTHGGAVTSTGVAFDNTGGVIDTTSLTGAGSVTLTHTGAVTVGAAITGGAVNISAGTGATGVVAVNAPVTTHGGSFQSTGGGGFSSSAVGLIDTTGTTPGLVKVTHPTVAVGGAIDAGNTGVVTLAASATSDAPGALPADPTTPPLTVTAGVHAGQVVATSGGNMSVGGLAVVVAADAQSYTAGSDAASTVTIPVGTVLKGSALLAPSPASFSLEQGAAIDSSLLTPLTSLLTAPATLSFKSDTAAVALDATLDGLVGGSTDLTLAGKSVSITGLALPTLSLGALHLKASGGSDASANTVTVDSTSITTSTGDLSIEGTKINFTSATPAVGLGATAAGTTVILKGAVSGPAIDLTVTGNASLAGVTLNSLDVTGNASVTGGSTLKTTGVEKFEGTTTVTGTGGTDFNAGDKLTFSGALSATTANVTTEGTLVTLGAGATSQALEVKNAANVAGDVTTTTGDLKFDDVVTVDKAGLAAVKFAAGTTTGLTFTKDLTATAAAVTTSGKTVEFDGKVTALSLTDTGATTINGTSIKTTANAGQTFTGDVTLGNAVVLTAGGANATVKVTGKVTAPTGVESVEVDFDPASTSTVTFGDAVGSLAKPLASVTVKNGATVIDGTDANAGVFTSTAAAGAQSFAGGVTLKHDATFRGFSIDLGSGLSGGTAGHENSVEIAASGTFTLNAATLPVSNVKDLTIGDATPIAGATTTIQGNVTTLGNTTFNDPTTLTGAALNLTSTTGSVIFNNTVGGAGVKLTVTGPATFKADVGGATPALALGDVDVTGAVTVGGAGLTFNVASLKFEGALNDTGKTTPVTVKSAGAAAIAGNVSVGGLAVTAASPITLNGSTIATSGAQSYGNDVVVGAAGAVLPGNVALTGGSIQFDGKLSGLLADVTLDASGAKTLGGGVVLDKLVTQGTGATLIHTGTVTTTQGQTYNDDVTLDSTFAPTVTLQSTANKDVAVNGNVTGAGVALKVTTGGITTLGGNVGTAANRLASVAVDASPTAAGTGVVIGTGGNPVSVLTTGDQTYNVAQVQLGGNATLDASTGALNFTQINATTHDLTLNQSPTLNLTGTAVAPPLGTGSLINVDNLTVNAPTKLTGTILTGHAQTFTGGVTLDAAGVTLNSTAGSLVTFGSTVNSAVGGPAGLTVGTAASFKGNVGVGNALGTLTVTGDAKVGGNAANAVDFETAVVDFQGQLLNDVATAVTVNVTTQSHFGGAVNVGALTVDTLNRNVSTVIDAGSVTTASGQTFNDKVTLGSTASSAAVTFDGGASTVTFGSTLSGLTANAGSGSAVTVKAGDLKTFAGNVDLGGLTVNDTGTPGGTKVGTGSPVQITTFGAEAFNTALTVGSSTVTLKGNSVSVTGPIDGAATDANTLVVNSAAATFQKDVGKGTELFRVTVDQGASTTGTLTLGNAGGLTTVQTKDVQSFNTATVKLAGDATLIALGDTTPEQKGGIRFVSLDGSGTYNLTLRTPTPLAVSGTTASPIIIADNVVTGVKNLTIGDVSDGATFLTKIRWTLTTTGSQVYNDKVTLAADATLASTSPTAPITFQHNATVDGGFALDTQAAGLVTFTKAVGSGARLSRLTTTGKAEFDDAGVLTTFVDATHLGNQLYGGGVTLGGTVPVTFESAGGGAVKFVSTLTGNTVAVTVNSAGVSTFGGAVSVGSLTLDSTTAFQGTTSVLGGAVTTLGDTTGHAKQLFNDAVTVGPDGATFSSSGAPVAQLGVNFASTLTSAGDVSIVGLGSTLFGGAVNVTAGSTTSGKLTTDALGAGTTIKGGVVTTSGLQNFGDAVNATVATTFGAGDKITFQKALTATGAVAVNTAADTTFGGQVNVTSGGLTTDGAGAGKTLVNGGLVKTDASQTFGDAVTIGAVSTQFTSVTGAVTFKQTLDGGGTDTTVTGKTATTFTGTVRLDGSLTNDGGGLTTVAGGLVQTNGSQTFANVVSAQPTAVPPVTLFESKLNAPIEFKQTLNATGDTTVKSLGDVTFDGAVTVIGTNGNLTTTGGGTTFVKGSSVTTTGNQDFVDNVSALPTATGLTTFLSNGAPNGNVNFHGTLVSGGDVTVTTGGTTTFGDHVTLAANGAAAGTLTTDASGFTHVDGNLIQTAGAQNFNDAVTVGTNPLTTLFTAGGAVTFAKTLDGGVATKDVQVTTGAATTFTGAVTLAGNLIADGGGTSFVDGSLVKTGGSQDFADKVQVSPTNLVNPLTTFQNDGAAAITFRDTLTATGNVTVTSGGVKTFDGAVSLVAGGSSVGDLLVTGGGGAAVNGRLVNTTGSQTYADDVTVNPGLVSSTAGDTTFSSVTGAIDFAGKLSGKSDVTVTTAGDTTFTGQVVLTDTGLTGHAGGLVVNGGGNTFVDGHLVQTDGSQDYFDLTTVQPAVQGLTTFTSPTNATVHFHQAFTAFGDVTVTTAGDTTFDGTVLVNKFGPATVDGNLISDNVGKTFFNGPTVTSNAAQTYVDDVIVSNPLTTFLSTTGQDIHFLFTVKQSPAFLQPANVVVTTSGLTTFDGLINIGGSLTTDGGGTTAVKGASVTTGLFQLFRDDVTVNPNANAGLTTFTSTGNGIVKFERSLTGASDVTVTTAGDTTFGGGVTLTVGNGGNANLLTNGGGNTIVRGRLVKTDGSQDFADAVQVTPNDVDPLAPTGVPTRFSSVANKAITFEKALTGTDSVQVTTDGVTTFGGQVILTTGNGATGDLVVNGAGDSIVEGRLVQTDGLQHFVGNVQVLPNTTLPGGAPTHFVSVNNATITYDRNVTGTDDVQVTTAGLTTFGGQVILHAGNGGAGNLTTDGLGNTTVNGSLVQTDGFQHFFDDVIVAPVVPPTLFHSVNDAFVHFEKSLTGSGDVTVTSGGLTTFGGLVDLAGNLKTDGNNAGAASGITLVEGRLVRTTGTQDFADDVQVAPDGSLPATSIVPAQPLTLFTSTGVAQSIHFERSLTGTSDVTVTTGGDTTFGGVVKLGSAAGINGDLITDGSGNTIVQGRLVQTAGLQHFVDGVIVTPNSVDPIPGAAPTLFTSLNNKTITFDKSLTGTDSVTVTTAGLTTFGGLVDLTAGGNLITDGGGNTLVAGRLVLTDGFQHFFDDVQLAPDATLPAAALVPAAPLTLFKSATDQFIHFELSLTGSGDAQVTTLGDTTFGGLVNVTGSLLTDGGGKTIVQGRLIQTGTTQDFKDDVVLAPNASLPATSIVPSNPLTLFKSTGDGTIHFEQTLTGSGDAQVTTAGLTTFDGLVNVTGSLTTDGGGVSAVNGASVTTGAFQLFRDDVTVNPNANAGLTTFLSTGNDFIKFERTVEGASDVTVTTAGLTTFGGHVILTTGNGGHANLLTNGGGITLVRGRLVQTDGHQDFADDVQVTPNDVDPFPPANVATHFLSVGNQFITFEKTLKGTDSVTVTTDGVTTFGGQVVLQSRSDQAGDLLVNGAGDSIVEGRLVQTDGFQHYIGNVQVLPNTTLPGGAPTLFTSINNAVITFDKKLTGVDDVVVTTAGLTTFGGQVILQAGNGGAGNLTTDGGGNTTVNGSLVQTDGFEHYFDDVIVAPVVPPTLFHSVNDAFVHFEKSLTGSGDVTVTTGGLTTFGGLVDLAGNLTTNGNGLGAASGITQVEGRLVRTTGFQDFADDVVVAPNGALPATSIVPGQPLTLFTSTGVNQPIHFERSLTGTSDVTVTTGGDTTFGGVVKLGGAAGINGDLITDGGGNTIVQGRLVQTAGLQHFIDDVIVTPNTVDPFPGAAPTLFTSLNNATITFDKSLTGTDSVTVTTAGLTTFGGLVDLTAGGNLITDGGGNTLDKGRLILTDGFQHFFDDVQVDPDGSLPATAIVPGQPLTLFKSATDQFIHFELSLTGNGNVQVTTNGDTTFGGLVNVTGSLLTDGGGKTIVQGRLVQTGLSQDFKDDVVVAPNNALPATSIVPGAPLTLFKSTGDQFIKFEKTLTGTGDVLATTAGDTTFAGLVDLSTGSLTTDGGGNTIVGGRLVRTAAFQLFRDDVQVLPTAGSVGSETLFTSTGNDTITFQRSLTGSDNVHVTTGGDTTFGGFVDLVGNLTSDGGGKSIVAGRLVQTTGFQDFLDDVKVSPDSSWPTTGSVPAPGQTLFRSTGNDAITFEQSLTGASDVQVTTGGLTTFKGLVNLVGNLATDGNAGGDLGTVIGATGVTGAGQVTTTGSQTYGDNVKLGTDAHLTSTGALDITFDGTVTGPQALVTSTAGKVIFEMPVDIGSLQTDGFTDPTAGVAVLNGHGILPFTINTLTFQDYKNAVQLGGDATLNSFGGSDPAGAVTFEGTVTGPHNLIVNTGGTTTFQKTVDVATLLTDAPGNTAVNGGIGSGFTIRTTGFQDFKDSVALGADGIFTAGGDVTFNQNLTGTSFNATVNSPATTTFKGLVSTFTLTTDAGGRTVIGDGAVAGHGSVTTGSFEHYNDDVVLGTDALLNAGGDVTFARTVTGGQSLVVNTQAITTFEGTVTIANLTTDAGGSTAINGGTVTTNGFQRFHDDVTLAPAGGATVLTAGGEVLFDGTVLGVGSSLRVTASDRDTFNKAVHVQSLLVDANGASFLNGPTIETTAGQDYGNVVTLGGQPLTITADAGDVTFRKQLTGPSALTITDHGVTTFDDTVTGLASLQVTATDGHTRINTPTVSTSGLQDYFNDVTFTDALTFTSTGGGALTFRSTVSGGPSLTVNTSGLATFKKDVSAQSFLSNAGGTTEIDGGLTTNGLITFNDLAHLANVAHLKSNNNAITFNGGSTLSGNSTVESGNAVITFKGATLVDGTAVITSQAGKPLAAAGRPGVDFEGATIVTGKATVHTTDAFVKFANTLGGTAGGKSVGSLTVATTGGEVQFLKAIGNGGKTSGLDLTVDATQTDAKNVRTYVGDTTFVANAAVHKLAVDARNISTQGITAASDISLQPSPTTDFFNFNTIPVDTKVNRQQTAGLTAKDPNRDQRPYDPGTNQVPSVSGILKLDGDIISTGGNVNLATAPRTGHTADGQLLTNVPSTVATITLMHPVPTDSDRGNTYTIHAGGDFKMGQNEKLTVIGGLDLSAGGVATLSDISTLGNLKVSAATIMLQTRAPGYTLTKDGQVASLDKGLDFFAGGDLTFNGSLKAFDPVKDTAPHNAGANDVGFGVLNGKVSGSSGIDRFPYHVNSGKKIGVSDFLYQVALVNGVPTVVTFDPSVNPGASFTLLDATPSGPSSTVITSVLAQALPAQMPTPYEEESLSGAALEALKDMGVYARELTSDEKIQKALGQVLYLELPMPTEDRPSEYKIAAARIPNDIALRILWDRTEILGTPPTNPAAVAAWEADAQQKIQDAIAAAYAEYQAAFKQDELPSGVAFREFLERDTSKYASVLATFQRIRRVTDKVHGQLGLSDARLDDCKTLLIKGLIPAGIDAVDDQFVLKAIFPETDSAAAKRDKELKEKEKEGKVATISANVN